ncbi:hypothetical protein BDQ12DRAFT_649037 [Crucibulum laeve]|uniref:Uncharacterized protein n=1 Tax=Crucibulum laeve TaxID=68775 RepID=A0A5C3M766_9AGAR|nr:hypothetical protein BDQ12DRAFT_649037 [Crucibulum laeve]
MAQALFAEHPLEEYLRDAGEAEFMPGSSAELEQEIDTMRDLYLETPDDDLVEWRPQLLIQLSEFIESLLLSAHAHLLNQPSPFVERFKYSVISSTLLAPSLPGLHTPRTPRSTSIPGKLDHSRDSSIDTPLSATQLPMFPPEAHYGLMSLAVVLAAALFSAGYPFLAILLSAISFFIVYNIKAMTDTPKTDMTPSLEALEDLIGASSFWESVVQDAITILENDERNFSASPASPSSPSSSIRIALHSSLQTTQTQCDNVRNLFSALTSPSELSQLSEMYAPPSPLKPAFSLLDSASRPFSLPSRKRTSSVPTNPNSTPQNKRATWNGSYSNLARAGSPTTQVYRRREKHRSNLSALLQAASPMASISAPVTPIPPSPGTPLDNVREDAAAEEESGDNFFLADSENFGAAALDLRRKRRTGGMEAFRLPPPSYFNAVTPTPLSPRSSTIASSSRFTTLQATRHPLSLSAVNHTLQSALSSKRYACSHLLALRFADEEDEGYWEDVRSVIALLTTTLVDASSRLSDALDDLERQRLEDQNPSPGVASEGMFPSSSDEKIELGDAKSHQRRQTSDRLSFAPMPTHISRFAAHIAAIQSSLDDAKEHLEQCVASLKEEPTSASSSPRSRTRSGVSTQLVGDDEVEEPAALLAYERLRRELGLALRECERGRERLLDIVHPPKPLDEEDEDSDELPGLGHDASDDSDKPDPEDVVDSEPYPDAAGFTVISPDTAEGVLDDATSHLLIATSAQHLPPPGIEQVFAADSENRPLFPRERSKLTREERIKNAKARRESGGMALGIATDSSSLPTEKRGIEKWGPGGEVVQELKDVIWKVGERRRKMTDGQLQSS